MTDLVTRPLWVFWSKLNSFCLLIQAPFLTGWSHCQLLVALCSEPNVTLLSETLKPKGSKIILLLTEKCMWNKLFFKIERYSHIHFIIRNFKENVTALRKATSSCSESLRRKICFLCDFAKSAKYPRLNHRQRIKCQRVLVLVFSLKLTECDRPIYPDLAMVTILLY